MLFFVKFPSLFDFVLKKNTNSVFLLIAMDLSAAIKDSGIIKGNGDP